MTDAQDLARRYLALWEEYLTALLTDPASAELAWEWALGRLQARDVKSDPGSAAGAATVAGASNQRLQSVAELARRVAFLEDRLAALERGGPASSRARRRNRRVRV